MALLHASLLFTLSATAGYALVSGNLFIAAAAILLLGAMIWLHPAYRVSRDILDIVPLERLKHYAEKQLSRIRLAAATIKRIAVTIRAHPKEAVRSVLTRKRLLVYGTAALVFGFHLWLLWTYTVQYVDMEALDSTLRVFYVLMDQGFAGVAEASFQINNYTGNPFFLLPVVHLLGYTPDAVRLALAASLAMGTALFFVAYHLLFGYRNAVLGAVILLSMSEWVFYRWFDYNYIILLIAVPMLLYAKWIDTGADARSPYLYLLAFVGGLAVYFKATVLYVLAALAVAAIYQKGVRLVKTANIPILAVLFLLGSSLFFAFAFIHWDSFSAGSGSSTELSLAGPVDYTIVEAGAGRFDQLGIWIRSDIQNLPHILRSGGETVFPYEFRPIAAPGGSLTGEPIDPVATLLGMEVHNEFSGIHLVSVLLLLSMGFLLWLRMHVQFVLIFAVFFVSMLFLPTGSVLRSSQMSAFAPLVPLIFLGVVDALSHPRRTAAVRAGYILLLALLLVSIGFKMVVLPAPADPGNEAEVLLHRWGGDQEFYEEFQQLDAGDHILTNSYRIHVISQYVPDTTSGFLFPANASEWEEIVSLPQTGGDQRVIWGRGGVAVSGVYPTLIDELDNDIPFRISPPETVILRETLPCTPGVEICGAATETVLRELGVDADTMNRTTIQRKTYLLTSLSDES